jgi:predicted LPLAT superfamily acyltransferase
MTRHWSQEKESVRTNFPILLTLRLIRLLPVCVVNVIAIFVSFFFFLFSRRARIYALDFQRRMKNFSGGKIPKKLSAYKSVLSFSLCLVERISGWTGKIQEENLIFNDDDISDYWRNLAEGRGAFVIGSHLGDMDLLRSLATFSRAGVHREIPVTVIMEIKSDENFNATLKKINPKYEITALDPKDIGPETITILQEKIQRGEIVVATGDRTSAHSKGRIFRRKFLGSDAEFPSGIFLMALLLQTPQTYFMFALRQKTVMLNPKNSVHVHRAKTDFQNYRRKERDALAENLCGEFVSYLEKYSAEDPFQWYNFFDFWQSDFKNGGEK